MAHEVKEDTARDLARVGIPFWLEEEPEPPLELWGLDSFVDSKATDLFPTEPLRITDVPGRPLFFEFAHQLSKGREIRVTTSASQILGSPIVMVEIRDNPLPLDAWIEDARRALGLRKRVPGERIVCHAYPRFGLLVPGKPDRIYDFMYRSVIEVIEETRGHEQTWSPLDRIRNLEEAVSAWQRSANALLVGRWQSFGDLRAKTAAVKPEIRKGKIPVELEPQNNPAYCSPATATMILWYLGFKEVIQEHLADRMETIYKGSPGDGTTPDGELKGYRDIFQGEYSVIRDENPQFARVRSEILELPKKGRPLKIGSNIGQAKHARAIAGWKAGPHGEDIYVCDPLPVRSASGGGRRRWEAWKQWTHTDLLYFQ